MFSWKTHSHKILISLAAYFGTFAVPALLIQIEQCGGKARRERDASRDWWHTPLGEGKRRQRRSEQTARKWMKECEKESIQAYFDASATSSKGFLFLSDQSCTHHWVHTIERNLRSLSCSMRTTVFYSLLVWSLSLQCYSLRVCTLLNWQAENVGH